MVVYKVVIVVKGGYKVGGCSRIVVRNMVVVVVECENGDDSKKE